MKKKILSLFIGSLIFTKLFSQGYPWERPLRMAWSNDGVNFNAPSIFQDSSGVPTVIKWKGDTLVCAFQWFRAPNGSLTWDRVAVKFSYDNGLSWTQPSPIVVNGLPANFQRPFDPALVTLNNDSIRIYFSSSDGMPNGGLDSTVNSYSAVSTDGVNYLFEPGARVDEVNNRVIDPSVIYFHHTYHYLAPIGRPQQGAYHYISPNGINFNKVQDIPSDTNHNWTGNYMLNDTGEIRFYGAGRNGIWYNSTPNGGMWNGYVNTNLQGGDPSVVRTDGSNYLIIYVGNQYTTGIGLPIESKVQIKVYPNPAANEIFIESDPSIVGEMFVITDIEGKQFLSERIDAQFQKIDVRNFASGNYFVTVSGSSHLFSIIKN
ncbi:hypothetical protein BH11BAC1_BH11BAC1_13800 [soil metagenome]